MSLNDSQVKSIAALARIRLSDDELDQTRTQLNRIFEIIESMNEIDTTGIEPLRTPLAAMGEVELRLREDVVTETDQRESFMRVAPSTQDGLFLVPKVIE